MSKVDSGVASDLDAIAVMNPATGETMSIVEQDSPESVKPPSTRVRANQADWEALGFRERRRWLGKLRDWMLDNADRIADTMQAETGKVRAEAANEAIYLTDQVNFYGGQGREVPRANEKVRPHSPMVASRKLRIQYRPYPVVGLISPWNFPLILSLGDAIPALMAGAAVVMKPSEFTPLGPDRDRRCLARGDRRPGRDRRASSGKAETATALIDDSDFIGFTGSDRTGKLVMARAAETLTPVSLELGGKDPMVVLEGANIERAVKPRPPGPACFNSGQMCISVERIYVEEPVYDEFVAGLTESVEDCARARTDLKSAATSAR